MRPAGWKAPGPPVRGDTGLAPADDEDASYLSGDWRLFQKKRGHRWSLDDLVTAAFAARSVERPPATVLDLGCGIGSVLLLLAWRFPDARCVGVEAQAVSAGLARKSIAYNGARAQVIDGDLRTVELGERFELVTGTPPYFPLGTGTLAQEPQAQAARFEQRGGPEEYCAAVARALADGGSAVLCASVQQLDRVFAGARAAGLTVTRWQQVVPKVGKPPLLACFALRRDGEPVELPALIVRDASDQWTEDFAAVREAFGFPPRA